VRARRGGSVPESGLAVVRLGLEAARRGVDLDGRVDAESAAAVTRLEALLQVVRAGVATARERIDAAYATSLPVGK
jgi:hypothetical protein